MDLNFVDFQKFIKGNIKDKFMVKILQCLRYVDAHPEYVNTVGIRWCKDYNFFISNSKKLAEFIGSNSNTVNKNFSSLAIKTVSCTGSEIAKEFPEIKEPGNWKKKVCQYLQLNRNTSEYEVSLIPFVPTRAALVKKSEIPEPALSYIKKNIDLMNKTLVIFKNLKRTAEYAKNIAEISIKDWKYVFGENFVGDIITMIGVICDRWSQSYDRRILFDKIRFLLEIYKDDSFKKDEITYPQYLKFVIQYGSIENSGRVVSMLVDYSEDMFHPWFTPLINERFADSYISTLRNSQWFVIPSSRLGAYMLYFRVPPKDLKAYIFFDATLNINHFSIEKCNGDFFTASSLKDILFNELGLNGCDSVSFIPNKEPELLGLEKIKSMIKDSQEEESKRQKRYGREEYNRYLDSETEHNEYYRLNRGL
jgi:hypothetical protein